MMTKRNRAIAALTAAAFAVSTAGVAPAFAANKAKPEAQTTSDATDISSQRRRYSNRGYGNRGYNNNAAGAAAFAAIVGGIATYAAARQYRKSRERQYQYQYGGYGAPYGYYGQPQGYYRGGYYGY